MATNSGVRITKNTISRTLTLYLAALPEATEAGAEAAMQAGAEAMLARLEAATTPTGEREHPAHPGRHDTGTLADEIIDPVFNEAGGGVYRINSNRNGNINYTFGFLDTENPPYVAAQELGTEELTGRGSGIPPMMAVQAGFNVVAARIENDIAEQLALAGRNAEAGKMYARARRAAG